VSGDCSHTEYAGTIEGDAWDDAGPTELSYVVEGVLRCPNGDVVVAWEGTAGRLP
jgi:hypothetical protein